MSAFAFGDRRSARRSEARGNVGPPCDDVGREHRASRPAAARPRRRGVAPRPRGHGGGEWPASRAVMAAGEAARAAEPDADVREYEGGAISAGEVDEMLSPSLFG